MRGRLSRLIVLLVEKRGILPLCFVVYTSIVAVIGEITGYKALTITIGIVLPSALAIHVYLSKMSARRKAAIAIRFRSESNSRVLRLLTKEILAGIDYAQGPRRSAPWRSRKLPTDERIRDLGEYVTSLFDGVATHFRLSREVIEDVFGTSAPLLAANLSRLVKLRSTLEADASRTLANLSHIGKPIGEPIQAYVEHELGTLRRHLSAVANRVQGLLTFTPEIVDVLQQVVKEPSTGKAAVQTSELLRRYLERPMPQDLAVSLLSLRRGLPLPKLLRFQELTAAVGRGQITPEALRNYLKLFASMSQTATLQLYDHAARVVEKHLRQHELIVTFGYSNAVAGVARVLHERLTASRIEMVVIEPRMITDWERLTFQDETARMLSALKEIEGLRVSSYDLDAALETGIHEKMTKIFLGTENVRANGTVIHPRGRRTLQKRMTDGGNKECQVYVLAQAYKFIELGDDIYHSPYFAAFDPGTDYDRLITERDAFEMGSSGLVTAAGRPFSLDDVRMEWEKFVDGFLREYACDAVFEHLHR